MIPMAAVTAVPATTATISPVNPMAQCRAQIAWLDTQARDVDDNLASLTHTACQIGEASAWHDPRLPALDETIAFWRNRLRGLYAQRRGAQARLVSLQATTPATC